MRKFYLLLILFMVYGTCCIASKITAPDSISFNDAIIDPDPATFR